MKSTVYKFFSTLSLGLALLISSGSVNAATYHFYQAFSNGGFVRGAFSGEDRYSLDMPGGVNVYDGPDGTLANCGGRYCPASQLNEVSEFSIRFGGNLLFEQINLIPEGRLMGIAYDINKNLLEKLFYAPCDGTCSPYWGYGGGYGGPEGGFIFIPGGLIPGKDEFFTVDATQSLQVSQVPLPGALELFIVGILFLSRSALKKQFRLHTQ